MCWQAIRRLSWTCGTFQAPLRWSPPVFACLQSVFRKRLKNARPFLGPSMNGESAATVKLHMHGMSTQPAKSEMLIGSNICQMAVRSVHDTSIFESIDNISGYYPFQYANYLRDVPSSNNASIKGSTLKVKNQMLIFHKECLDRSHVSRIRLSVDKPRPCC